MEKLTIFRTAEGSVVALTQRQKTKIKTGLALAELASSEAGPQKAAEAVQAAKVIREVLEGVVPSWND